MPTKAIPDGFHTVTPYLVIKGAAKAIDFYKKAFGAEELARNLDERNGRILNAQLKIGDSMIMLNDEYPEWGSVGPSPENPSTVSLHLYVKDADSFFKRAVSAGAEVTMPLADMFWGDRYGKLKDPFGHTWAVATRTKDLTPQQVKEGAKKAFAEMPS